MSKNAFKNYICKPHCVFYKDGEKEEMACQGALIARRLVKNLMLSPGRMDTEPDKKDTRFKEDEIITHHVCGNCSFEEQDCDFRSACPPENTVPCGGYIFLYRLKSKGLITAKNIVESCCEEK